MKANCLYCENKDNLSIKCFSCTKVIYFLHNTIHCIKCHNFWCINCFNDFNDENYPIKHSTELKNTRAYLCYQDNNGVFCSDSIYCDLCNYGP